MFLVSDSLSRRAEVIRNFLRKYPSISVVIAATYFEWTVSRALVALSRQPNTEVREALVPVHAPKAYSRLWWDQLQDLPSAQRLTEVISNWQSVIAAFNERNRLVHGRDRHTRNMATPHVESLLNAVAEIHEYCQSHGVNLGYRLPVRRKFKRSVEPLKSFVAGGR
jgi:hypothetical protein